MLHEHLELFDRKLLDRLYVVSEEVNIFVLDLYLFLANIVRYFWLSVTKV